MDCCMSVLAPFVATLSTAASEPSVPNLLFAAAVLAGFVTVGNCLLGMVLYVVSIVTGPCLRPNLKKQYGPWAVVTGATDGIGLAYAKQLAKKGLNIVLISRTQARLEAAAEAITSKYPVETKIIQADFSQSVESGLYDRIRQELGGLEIGMLVNNVGMSYPSALFFHELDDIDNTLTDKLLAINVNATTQMTRLVVGDMVKRKKGAIINVASAAGRVPIGNPLFAVYSGTKAYVDYFSRSLHHELKGYNVHVQCQSPYFVTSKMSKIRKPTLSTPNPDTYAAAAVASIGSGDSVVPYWAHALQDSLLRSLPHFILSSMLLSMHAGLRRRFMKKRAEKRD